MSAKRLIASDKIIQVTNLLLGTSQYGGNPYRGRVYYTKGCAPALNTCGGGWREPKWLILPKRRLYAIGRSNAPTGFSSKFHTNPYVPCITQTSGGGSRCTLIIELMNRNNEKP